MWPSVARTKRGKLDLPKLFSEIDDLCKPLPFSPLSPLRSPPFNSNHPKNNTELEALFTEIDQFLAVKLPQRVTGLGDVRPNNNRNNDDGKFKKPRTPPRKTKVFCQRSRSSTEASKQIKAKPSPKQPKIPRFTKSKVQDILKEIDAFCRVDLPGGLLTGLDDLQPRIDCKRRESNNSPVALALLKPSVTPKISDDGVLTTVILPVEAEKSKKSSSFVSNNSNLVETNKSRSTLSKEKIKNIIFPDVLDNDSSKVLSNMVAESRELLNQVSKASILVKSQPVKEKNSVSSNLIKKDTWKLVFPGVLDSGTDSLEKESHRSDLKVQKESTPKDESSGVNSIAHDTELKSNRLMLTSKIDKPKSALLENYEKSSGKSQSSASLVANQNSSTEPKLTSKPTVIFISSISTEPEALDNANPNDLFGDLTSNSDGEDDLEPTLSDTSKLQSNNDRLQKDSTSVVLPHDRIRSQLIDPKRVPKTKAELADLFQEISEFCRLDLPFRLMDLDKPDELRLSTKVEIEKSEVKPKLTVQASNKKQVLKTFDKTSFTISNPFVPKINTIKREPSEKITTTIVEVESAELSKAVVPQSKLNDASNTSTKRKRGWRKNMKKLEQPIQVATPPPTPLVTTSGGIFDLKSSLLSARNFISSLKKPSVPETTKPPEKTSTRGRKKAKRDPSEMNDSGYSSQGSVPSPVPSDLDSVVSLCSSTSSLVRAEPSRPQVYLYSQYDYYTDLVTNPRHHSKRRNESKAIKHIRSIFDQNQKVLEWRLKNFTDSKCPPTPPSTHTDFKDTPPPTPEVNTQATDDYLDLDCFDHECKFELDDDADYNATNNDDQWLQDMFQDDKSSIMLYSTA